MAQEVRARMVNHLKGAPTLYIVTDDDTASEDEEAPPTHMKWGLKSSKCRIADSLVTKQIVWPHEVVYTSQGQPAVYSELSVALFVSGYFTVLAEVCEDIKDHYAPTPGANIQG